MRDQTRKLRRRAVGEACIMAEGSLAALGVTGPQVPLLPGHTCCGSTPRLHPPPGAGAPRGAGV